MSVNIDNAKEILNNFNTEVAKFTANNKLSELPAYVELQKKHVIGALYRSDQKYFETLSTYKANYFGIKSFFIKERSTITDRNVLRDLDSVEKLIDEKIKYLDTLVSAAKQRVKFFENVIYLVANMSYGDF